MVARHFAGEFRHDLAFGFHEALRVRGVDIHDDVRAALTAAFGDNGFPALQDRREFIRRQPVMEAWGASK